MTSPSPLPTVEVNRRRTHRALQAAAVGLVGERGLLQVTVDDIAAAAGVARRTFFNYFPTKAAALFDPDPADADRLAEILASVPGPSGSPRPSDTWAGIAAACCAFAAGHESVLAVRRRLVDEDPTLGAYHRVAHRHVIDTLATWSAGRHPDDRLLAGLLAEAASAVLIAAFEAWEPDEPPARFIALLDRGFSLVSPATPVGAGTPEAPGDVRATPPGDPYAGERLTERTPR